MSLEAAIASSQGIKNPAAGDSSPLSQERNRRRHVLGPNCIEEEPGWIRIKNEVIEFRLR